jgi:hypothetical protein
MVVLRTFLLCGGLVWVTAALWAVAAHVLWQCLIPFRELHHAGSLAVGLLTSLVAVRATALPVAGTARN